MSLTVMNFNRIRDLVSNLGCMKEDNTYILSQDCLKILENLEEELLNEDVIYRNVRISLHICGTVKEDLIPILTHGRDFNILATATRLLVSLSLPAECLLHFEEAALSPKHLNIYKQLALSTLAIKKAFLNASATSPIVSMLRETIIKSEKHLLPLKDEECEHLKNCLTFIRNLLHLPENFANLDKNCIPKYADWHSVQNKLIWNLFVQGFDGALILMLNSKYKDHWTVPLALIIALLFRNQNIGKIHQSLELVSSASESSGDDEEESDNSKNSSFSLSSEHSKNLLSDSGCPQTSESSGFSCATEINQKLEKVQLNDLESEVQPKINANSKIVCRDANINNSPGCSHSYFDNDSESSSSSESPYHKKIKGSTSANESPTKCDSGMDYSSPEGKSSDEDNFNEKRVVENLKAVQKLKSVQLQSESDSSSEDFQMIKIKQRSHPPTGRRGKSPRRKDGCIPLVCIESAYDSKGRIKYPLWEKRSSVCTLIDAHSSAPSDDDIGFLLKEFTLSFLHSGFSDLVVKIRQLLLNGPPAQIDKSLLFWMLSYFLHLAASVNLSLNHVSPILSSDFVTFLLFECVNACENMELHFNSNDAIKKYISVHLNLIVTAFKEIMNTLNLYFRKSCSQKDRTTFNELYGQLSEMQCFRQIPLLLFQVYPKNNSKQFLEDMTVLNHHTLIAIDRGTSYNSQQSKINMMAHLRQFASKNTVECCRKVLENFKFNSHFLNECVFTLLHHLAGDIRATQLLMEPSILKVFSEILNEDIELEQYQEDLIMYILNKFSRQVQKRCLKRKQMQEEGGSKLSDDSSNNSSVSSHCLLIEEDDDLFWWYLQFEQDKDPISRISEHVSTSKQDILNKLQIKGYVSTEKLKLLEEKMKAAEDTKLEVVPPNEDLAHIANYDDDVTLLLRTLVQSGERQHLIWLQDILLETCHAKLNLDMHSTAPIVHYSIKMMMPVPIVPFTVEQRAILKNKSFLRVLQMLGLHPGIKDCPMYPKIPLFWTADMIFAVAARLGPIKKEKMKFSYEDLQNSVYKKHPEGQLLLLPLSSCSIMSSWLTAVQQSKEHFIVTTAKNEL